MALRCKKCDSGQVSKSGKANGKQRYFCKKCGLHFTIGDGRTSEHVAAKKAMCVVLYSIGNVSFRALAKMFNTSPSLTHRWVVKAGCTTPRKATPHRGEIKQVEFDKVRSYIKTKQLKMFDGTKPLTIISGDMGQGYSAIVILQPLDTNET